MLLTSTGLNNKLFQVCLLSADGLEMLAFLVSYQPKITIYPFSLGLWNHGYGNAGNVTHINQTLYL